jgi:uncharacterized protein
MTGGDGKYHDFDKATSALSDFLAKANFEVTASKDLDMFLPQNIADHDVIICNSINSYLSEEHEAGLLGSLMKGKPKGFIGFHGATFTFRNSANYTRMIGARFLTHPQIGEKFDFTVERKNHPVMKGVSDFSMPAELYLVEEYPPFETLISVQYKGFARPVAWTKPYGFGKVAYLSLGHDLAEIDTEVFRKIIINAVTWIAGEE